MKNGAALDLNLATRPLRNRRLYMAAARLIVLLLIALAGLSAFVIVKYGGEAARIKSASAATRKLQDEAGREEKRLSADIEREEKLSKTRVDLVNSIIRRKTFLWTGLFSELEKALPGPSYITALSPGFTGEGAVTMDMQVTSRSLADLLAFIDALTARGFKNIQVGGETRSDDGRLLAVITVTYERPL
jgi:Tfp pilus assembly protein PilN